MGVARQYCGQVGKRASCQALVSLTLAGREVPVPVGLRLFLPEEWTRDPERCAAAGVPAGEVVARAKGEIALAALDRLIAAGVRFGVVLADAGYGASAAFRRELSKRGLTWAVGIPRNQKVYAADVRLVPPTGRRRRPVPDQEPREAEAVLADLPWRRTLSGIWEVILTALAEADPDAATLQMIDSTTVRTHQCAAGAKGGLIARVLAVRVVASRPSSMPTPTRTAGRSAC